MFEDTTPNRLPQSLSEDSQDSQLADLLAEYLSSLENGVPLELDELVARYPHLEKDIRELAVSVDILHSATVKHPEAVIDSHLHPPCKSVGDFEIVREIGRGGMGVVYEARQISLDRKVALKVLPFASMLDEKQVTRFRNEAQAAAQLQHPGIVPVFAIGQERGVQYYAMQYISGRSLAEVIWELQTQERLPLDTFDIATLSTQVDSPAQEVTSTDNPQPSRSTKPHGFYRRIAELGLQAALALHHAHECGVVHRDIKPSNLLLDDQGKVWITDFGLARVKDNPGVTMTGDVVGTLRYMSPEQASGKPALVDQRTDVYALGATLYEFLTLHQAHPGEDRRQVQRAVELEEPIPPRTIDPGIPVDLETIVLAAMTKSRDERYASAEAVAEDLERYLHGKPTLARRPTLVDRGAKWLRRHRRIAVASCLGLVALAIFSTFGALTLSREKAEKEAALVRSQENLEQARMVVDRFGTYFSHELERLPGSETIRQELLEDTLNYYHHFIAQAQEDPELRAELAATAFKAGETSKKLGSVTQAHELFGLALKTFEELDSGKASSKYLEQRAICLNELGLLEIKRGKLEVARIHLEAAIELHAKWVSEAHLAGKSRVAQAELLMNLGLLDNRMGKTASGIASVRLAISKLEELVARDNDPRHRHGLAIAISNLSFVQQQDDLKLAKESSRTAISILEDLLEAEALAPTFQDQLRQDLALCYNNLGAIESHLGFHLLACQLHDKAIVLQKKLSQQSPAVVEYRNSLAVSYNNLGQAFTQAGKLEQSNEAFEQARGTFRQLSEAHPADVSLHSSLAGVLNNQAMSLEHAGDLKAAAELFELAIQRQELAVERAPQAVVYRKNLSTHYANYGRVLRKLNRLDEATQTALEHLKVWPENGEHKYHIARELAVVARLVDLDHQQEELRAQIVEHAISLLEDSFSADNRPRTEPIDELEFTSLSKDERFQLLLSKRG